MLYRGVLGVELSGALGGVVASHNKGGAYFRERVIPTNPNSPQQQAVRNAVAQLSSQWQSSLTEPQRQLWDTYAKNVTITNRIGDQVQISAMAHFVRSNVSRKTASLAIIENGPASFNLGSYTAPTLSNATEAGQTIDLNFNTGVFGDEWANTAGAYMFVYFSRPQNSGIKYFRGPYRLAGVIVGDPVPPASPETLNVPFAFSAGQRLFGRATVTQLDGRYSTASFQTVLAAA